MAENSQTPMEKLLATKQPKDLWDLLNNHAPTDFFPDGKISYKKFHRVCISMVKKILSILDPQKNLYLNVIFEYEYCMILPTNLVEPEALSDPYYQDVRSSKELSSGHVVQRFDDADCIFFYQDVMIVDIRFDASEELSSGEHLAQDFLDADCIFLTGGMNSLSNENPWRYLAGCLEYFESTRTNIDTISSTKK